MDSVFILSAETGELLIEHQNPGSTTAGNKKKEKPERERERGFLFFIFFLIFFRYSN